MCFSLRKFPGLHYLFLPFVVGSDVECKLPVVDDNRVDIPGPAKDLWAKTKPLVWACGETEERSWPGNIGLIHHCSHVWLSVCAATPGHRIHLSLLAWVCRGEISSGKTLTSKLSMFDYFRSYWHIYMNYVLINYYSGVNLTINPFSNMNKSCSTVWCKAKEPGADQAVQEAQTLCSLKVCPKLHQDSTYRRSLGRWRKRLDHHPLGVPSEKRKKERLTKTRLWFLKKIFLEELRGWSSGRVFWQCQWWARGFLGLHREV